MISNSEPLVSIIVPNYNHSPYLNERLNSVFNQTLQDFEVILLDDASDDGSSEILKLYSSNPKVSYCLINKENSGYPFKQWNKGLNLTKGKYIWIAESDDYADLDFLEKMVGFHSKYKDLALVFCQSHRIDSTGRINGSWIKHTSDFQSKIFMEDFIMDGNLFIENYLIHKNVIPNVSGVIFKRDSLQKILPLEIKPYFRLIGDWYYYIQLLCNSKVGFFSEPINYFREHSLSVIARAGRENHRYRIVKMEFLGRKKMMKYISECRPWNLKSIKKAWRIRTEKLNYELIIYRLKKGDILNFMIQFIFNPKFAKHLITNLKNGLIK
ncbi:glycosyltransferase family 2 protein [Gramella jeungdoensis]|uniref:Glycosyltransferase family 2 protein n=1 Tax=Gramella jeungdoensis TaxID=708091 RepID=A0ABT0Z0F4_9FLAO|nr:glycosyltransferase family 2 protein [Gramella jeungdoensis]MCM8569195.1 glycosyltransferase family 2 protein [Gramella jeungdoensis]